MFTYAWFILIHGRNCHNFVVIFWLKIKINVQNRKNKYLFLITKALRVHFNKLSDCENTEHVMWVGTLVQRPFPLDANTQRATALVIKSIVDGGGKHCTWCLWALLLGRAFPVRSCRGEAPGPLEPVWRAAEQTGSLPGVPVGGHPSTTSLLEAYLLEAVSRWGLRQHPWWPWACGPLMALKLLSFLRVGQRSSFQILLLYGRTEANLSLSRCFLLHEFRDDFSLVELLRWLMHQAVLSALQLSGCWPWHFTAVLGRRSPREAETPLSVKHRAFMIRKSVMTRPNTLELEMGGGHLGTPPGTSDLFTLSCPGPCFHVCGWQRWGAVTSLGVFSLQKQTLVCVVRLLCRLALCPFYFYLFITIFILFIYLAVQYSLWDLSSPTRSWTWAPSSGSVES